MRESGDWQRAKHNVSGEERPSSLCLVLNTVRRHFRYLPTQGIWQCKNTSWHGLALPPGRAILATVFGLIRRITATTEGASHAHRGCGRWGPCRKGGSR